MLTKEYNIDVYMRKFRGSWAWITNEWKYIYDFTLNENDLGQMAIIAKIAKQDGEEFWIDTEPEYKAFLPGLYTTPVYGPILVTKRLLKSYLVGINFDKNYHLNALVNRGADQHIFMRAAKLYDKTDVGKKILVIDKFWYCKEGVLYNLNHPIGDVDDSIKSLYHIPQYVREAIQNAR